jgi:hypothetical protein
MDDAEKQYRKGIEHGANMLAKEIDRLCMEAIRKSGKVVHTGTFVERLSYCCYNCADARTRMTTMILCPKCGNKRCPHSTDHNLECTNSNEPGQPGSRYE